TIVKCILNILKQAKKKVLLVAPTGRAAKRLSETTGEEAKTIHRALEIDFKGEHGRFKYNENNPLDIDCLIIDEVSMVDIMLMCSVLKALKRDCKLILVGDKDQLPSVGAGNVLDDIIKSETIKINYLTQIFRQDENSLIITNAHKINSGEMPEIDNSSKDFFFESKLEPIDVKNTIVDLVTERIPNYFKVDIAKIQILAPLKAGVSGVESLNQELQEKLNPPSYLKYEIVLGKTVFREGDKVMQTANNYDLCWKKTSDFSTEEGMGIFNGDIGYIHKINRQNGEVTVWFDDGRECTYPRTEIGDLSLAYAITIHKSQGSEFDIVVIPLVAGAPMILTRNLIYTAVTRAKKTVMLVGDKRVLNRMIKNTFVVKRNTMLQNFLVESNDKIQKLFG
ncbi:MAG: AAA family ATPase, partial [Clostridia bacterium]|nr:AAA family ATPase [Clostridia bacterium]